MTRLPLLGLLFLLFTSQASAQPAAIHSTQSEKRNRIPDGLLPQPSAKSVADTLRYKTFTKIKDEFVVNSGTELYGSSQDYVTIVNGPDGAFLCAWADIQSFNSAINAQLFDKDGNRTGPLIHVSDNYADLRTKPSLVFNPKSNEYIVLWVDYVKIMIQRLSITGEKIGTNKTIGDNNLSFKVSATVDSAGNIIAAWITESLDGSAIPYIRIVSKDGVPLEDQRALSVADSGTIEDTREDIPIASDNRGRSIIVWNRTISTRSQLVLQAINQNGNIFAEPIVVNDLTDSVDLRRPALASTKDGHFFILWTSRNGTFGRIFHPDSGFVTPQLAIAGSIRYWSQYFIASDDANIFYIVGNKNPFFGQAFTAQGQPFSAAVTLPIPSIAGFSIGRFNRAHLCFTKAERMQTDVYVQTFDLSFLPIGGSRKAAEDNRSATQIRPEMRYNRFGEALMVWTDTRNGYYDLYGQMIDAGGNPISSNIRISDTTNTYNSNPSISCDPDGNFVVAFAAGDQTSKNLRLQKLLSNGLPGSGNVDVGSTFHNNYNGLTSRVTTDSARNTLVCWWSDDYNTPLYCRRYDAAINAQGPIRRIFNAAAKFPMYIIGISTNRYFRTLVLWSDYRADRFSDFRPPMGPLKAMVIGEDGRVVRDTIDIGIISKDKFLDMAECKIDDNNDIIIAWSESGYTWNDRIIHIKRIYSSGEPPRTDSIPAVFIYSRLQIVKFENKKSLIAWDDYNGIHSLFLDDEDDRSIPVDLQTSPSIDYSGFYTTGSYCAAHYGDVLFLAYQKILTPDRSYDICANMQHIDRLDMDWASRNIDNVISVYPNPVRQSATFRYAFSRPTEARIAVYNILGQKIADVVQGMKPAGQYTVQFPTRNLPAGVYFFVINGIKTSTTKFIVVK